MTNVAMVRSNTATRVNLTSRGTSTSLEKVSTAPNAELRKAAAVAPCPLRSSITSAMDQSKTVRSRALSGLLAIPMDIEKVTLCRGKYTPPSGICPGRKRRDGSELSMVRIGTTIPQNNT